MLKSHLLQIAPDLHETLVKNFPSSLRLPKANTMCSLLVSDKVEFTYYFPPTEINNSAKCQMSR